MNDLSKLEAVVATITRKRLSTILNETGHSEPPYHVAIADARELAAEILALDDTASRLAALVEEMERLTDIPGSTAAIARNALARAKGES